MLEMENPREMTRKRSSVCDERDSNLAELKPRRWRCTLTLLFFTGMEGKGKGGEGRRKQKRGGTYAQSCNSVSMGEKFTRSVAQV